MKKFIYFIMVFTFCFVMFVFTYCTFNCTGGLDNASCKQAYGALQPSIAKKVIRFHVIADSDSEVAQEFKLKVRDEVLKYMKMVITGDEDIETTRKIIYDNLDMIEFISNDLAKKEGLSYDINAELTTDFFPIKEYASVVFPAGYYEALRINIGKAQGKNWWCIMYPNLCFIDGTYAIIDERTKEEIRRVLTDEEYRMLIEGSKTKVSFKLLKWLRNL